MTIVIHDDEQKIRQYHVEWNLFEPFLSYYVFYSLLLPSFFSLKLGYKNMVGVYDYLKTISHEIDLFIQYPNVVHH
jgi:hypothetical protein